MLGKLPYKTCASHRIFLPISFLLLNFLGIGQESLNRQDAGMPVEITWEKNVEGDFSFIEDWSYPESVYVNKFGQLSCDGVCPAEIDRMKDSTGRIYQDSLASFYQYVDTTHYFHSMVAQGSMYEWAGSNQIDFKRKPNGTIFGSSMCNAVTHTSINFEIEGDVISVWLEYIGIMDGKRHTFPLKSGWIQIDKKHYKRGIVKAIFHFDFENNLEALVPLNCEGMIYSEIEE